MENYVKFGGGGAISVIIPVYNVEKYLSKCLDSVINNTYRDLEIICVNDGSTDGSLDILNEYAARDDRISVISQENQGLSGARNTGIENSHADYIAFIDSDDFVHRQYFEILMRPMLENNADMSVASDKSFSNDSDIASVNFDEYGAKLMPSIDDMFENATSRRAAWGKIYRRDFIGNERFVDRLKFEDICFNGLLFAKRTSPVMYYTDVKIYYYRQVPTSISHSSDASVRLGVVDICLNKLWKTEIIDKAYLMDVIVNAFAVSKHRTEIKDEELKTRIKMYEKKIGMTIRKIKNVRLRRKLYWLALIKTSSNKNEMRVRYYFAKIANKK